MEGVVVVVTTTFPRFDDDEIFHWLVVCHVSRSRRRMVRSTCTFGATGHVTQVPHLCVYGVFSSFTRTNMAFSKKKLVTCASSSSRRRRKEEEMLQTSANRAAVFNIRFVVLVGNFSVDPRSFMILLI